MRPYLQATKRRAAAIGGIQRRSAAISGWSYGVSLARAIASSSVSNFVTARTGLRSPRARLSCHRRPHIGEQRGTAVIAGRVLPSEARRKSDWKSAAIRGNNPRQQSEAIRGPIRGNNQRQSEAIRGNPRQQSAAIRGNPRQSDAIRCYPRRSEAIRGHPRSSEVIRGHLRQSEAVRPVAPGGTCMLGGRPSPPTSRRAPSDMPDAMSDCTLSN